MTAATTMKNCPDCGVPPPFEASLPSSWEGRFWHTAQIILEACDQTIESWLGADQARAPKQLLSEYVHAVEEAAKVRVETAAELFASWTKKARQEAHAKADALTSWEMRRNFRLVADQIWETKCPACKAKAFLAGVKYNEEPSDEEGEEYEEEMVDIFYVAEEFECPSCHLHLDSRAKTAARSSVKPRRKLTLQRLLARSLSIAFT